MALKKPSIFLYLCCVRSHVSDHSAEINSELITIGWSSFLYATFIHRAIIRQATLANMLGEMRTRYICSRAVIIIIKPNNPC
uniref:Secreted protein n=1 Tax=Ascaris lumbricoides TaxID=6252 RepID=A0A0M3IFS1_ASCLU